MLFVFGSRVRGKLAGDGLVKFLAFVLPFIAFLAPLMYGLSEHDWSLSSLVAFHYTPPRIGVEMEPKTLELSDSGIVLGFQVNNTGELELRIISFKGSVHTSEGVELGDLTLVEEVVLPPGGSEELALNLKLKDRALRDLVLKLMQARNLDMLIEGKMRVEVFGLVAEVPISESFEVRAEDLGLVRS